MNVHVAKEDGVEIVEAVVVVVVEAAAVAHRFARSAHLHFPFLRYLTSIIIRVLIFTASSPTRSSSYVTVGQVVEDQQVYAPLLQPAQRKPGLGSCGSPVWY